MIELKIIFTVITFAIALYISIDSHCQHEARKYYLDLEARRDKEFRHVLLKIQNRVKTDAKKKYNRK